MLLKKHLGHESSCVKTPLKTVLFHMGPWAWPLGWRVGQIICGSSSSRPLDLNWAQTLKQQIAATPAQPPLSTSLPKPCTPVQLRHTFLVTEKATPPLDSVCWQLCPLLAAPTPALCMALPAQLLDQRQTLKRNCAPFFYMQLKQKQYLTIKDQMHVFGN